MILLLTTVSALAEKMEFPQGTALWAKPTQLSKPGGFLKSNVTFDVKARKTINLQRSVISCKTIFYKTQCGYWLTPKLRVNRMGRVYFHESSPGWRWIIPVFLLILSASGAAGYYYRDSSISKKLKLNRSVYLLFSLILLHYAWMAYLYIIHPGMYQTVTDEREYFRIAKCILHWDFSEPFKYTIGYPLFCTPFIPFFGNDFPAMSQFISYISAMLAMPLTIFLSFQLIKKISKSELKAYIALLLCLILPKLFSTVELPFQGVLFCPFGLYHNEYIYLAYQFCISGHNSLSEWVSVNLVLGILLAVIQLKGNYFKYTLISVFFGLALLVRMNNSCFAPLIAYLIWINDREKLTANRAYLVKSLLITVGLTTAIFSSQLTINYIQQGSILKTPYTILYRHISAGGVSLKYFSGLSAYYFKIQGLYMLAGIGGMAFIKNRQLRNILILWTLPTIVFFCCFNFTGYPYRFFLPIYPGLAAALVCCDLWNRDVCLSHRWFIATVIIFITGPILPLDLSHMFDRSSYPLWNWPGIDGIWFRVRLFLAVPAWLTALYIVRKNKICLFFLLVYGILITSWSHWLIVATIVLLLLWCLVTAGREVVHAFSTTATKNP